MPEIQQFITRLIETGHAYVVDGDVYFRIATVPDYGKLSRRSLDDMIAGNRISVDERKENPADFALWKAAKPGEPFWDSPWGPGRPGWHIECSAMNLAHLGEQIDIHGGGADLIFPHHENEIAQTESLTGKPFARYWMHNGMLQIQTRLADGTYKLEKMSKSLGNVVTIREFLARYHPDVLRLTVLSSSYRSPLAFGEEIAADQERKLDRLRSALEPPIGTMKRDRRLMCCWQLHEPPANGSSPRWTTISTRLAHWRRSSIWCARSTLRAMQASAGRRSPKRRRRSAS
jgi:cysteinyl-tRNA synthetase (EC 6.1.1.16)